MRNSVWVSLAAVTVLTSADPAVLMRRATPRQGVVRPSQERLDQIRRSLMAQIAVRDAEGMRAPTGAEAAALRRPLHLRSSSRPAVRHGAA